MTRVYLVHASVEQVMHLMLGLLGMFAGRAAAVWGMEVASNATAVRIKTRLSQALLDYILNLGPAYVREQETGELVNTCMEGVEALDAYFSQYLPQVFLPALIPLTYLVFIFPPDPITVEKS